MYYDEIFDLNDEYSPISNAQNKELNKIKSMDKDYGCVYRHKLNLNGKKVLAKIDLYVSGDIGSSIRNAATGSYYKYKVGSFDEEKLFKIKMATGEIRTRSGNTLLFFDSPEQYESHLMEEISDEIKELWRNKTALHRS
jgi:hypothetical protein